MIGQINLDSEAGGWIAKICAREDIKTIVEIGTWNGFGSTKCAYQSIVGTDKTLLSLESDKGLFDGAKEVYKDAPEVSIVHGHISEKLIHPNTLRPEYFTDYSQEEKTRWYERDLANINSSANVLDQLPEKIDFLILDGGEFSSWYEFVLLKDRFKVIFLDDTRPPCIKNHLVREFLLKSARLLVDNQEDRNGFSVFEL